MTENTDISNRDMLIYEMRKKSIVVAYALWFFLGTLGIYYFYLGNNVKALWRLIPSVVLSLISLIGIASIDYSNIETILNPYQAIGETLLIPLIGYVVLWVVWIIDACTLPEQVKRYNAEVLQGITRNTNTE